MITLKFSAKGRRYSVKVDQGDELLLALDNILKKNKIKFTDLKNLKLFFSPSVGLTSQRIAKAILMALNFSQNNT